MTHKPTRLKLKAIVAAGSLIALLATTGVSAEDQPACPSATFTLLRGPDGGRVDWRPDGAEIAYDHRPVGRMCYDISLVKPDGAAGACLTCGKRDLPAGSKGNPAWSPDGRYLVFQAEKSIHRGPTCGFFTNPGAGLFNDLWVMDTRTGKSRRLYVASGLGNIHPHFSPDGKRLLWSELYAGASRQPPMQAGKFALKIADVSISATGEMSLTNIRQLLPTSTSGEGLVESHGFTPDGARIVFSGNLGYRDNLWRRNDIFTADLDGRNVKALTNSFYNEHAQFSPSGKHIAWMSSAASPSGDERDGTEVFLMDADGKNRCQISHFNRPGYPESQGENTTAGDISWRPDGSALVAYTHNRAFGDPAKFRENIWLVTFSAAQ